MAGEDPIAKARGEALDLSLDPLGHVDVRPRRHVAVGPERLLAGRCPRRVDDARLDDDAIRALGVSPGCHLGLALGDFGEASRRGARVAVSEQTAALHGTGPSSAQSTLKMPGP